MLGVVLLASLTSCSGRAPGTELSIRPGGIYATTVNGVKVFVADRNRRAVVFVNSAQHLPGEQVWWCPNEKVFVAPADGELFDADGRYLAGPASKDLDRVAVVDQIEARLTIDLTHIQQGEPRSQPDTFAGLSPDVKSRYIEWATRKQGGAEPLLPQPHRRIALAKSHAGECRTTGGAPARVQRDLRTDSLPDE